MNILFYYPDRDRAVSLSSLMIAFQKQGHRVFLLTQEPEGDLHRDVKPEGIAISVFNIPKTNSLIFYIRHIWHLIFFVRKNKVDIVYSHVQPANFISCFALHFTSSRFFLCRHHSDCGYLDDNYKERMMDKIINFFGKEFIVPSKKVFEQMMTIEHVIRKKIYLIRYAYDFSRYPKPNIEALNEIRDKYKCRLLLIKVARLIPEKRHIVLFNVVNNLVRKGFDIKLIVLSDGPEYKNLENFVIQNNLGENIFMLGYKRNAMDYLAASDLVVHVSESEASNNLIKEAAFLEKPVIVCRGVGDFDEYIVHNQNGLMLAEKNPEEELFSTLVDVYHGKVNTRPLGIALKNDVTRLFSVENIINEYRTFNS